MRNSNQNNHRMGKPRKQRSRKGNSQETAVTSKTALSTRYDASSLAESSEDDIIVSRLAARSYHLPGNNWCQDWVQYMLNNHPFLGIFCHHRLHPIGLGTRIVCLIGSIAFGLVATNCVFLYYAHIRKNLDDVAFSIHLENNTTIIDAREATITITHGMIALWTLGGILHSIFDLCLWHISACACCLPSGAFSSLGKYRTFGSYFVLITVAVLVAAASFVVVLRASVVSRQETVEKVAESRQIDPSSVKWGHVSSFESFSFLVSYVVELTLAMLLYFPLVGTILFSGILGCACLPILGGRPVQVRKEQRRQLRELENERYENP